MRSKTFCSAFDKPCGIIPVGMMAWWSVTFVESKTFFGFGSGFPPSFFTNSAYGFFPEKAV